MIKIKKLLLKSFLLLSLLINGENKVFSCSDPIILQSEKQIRHKKKMSARARKALDIVQNAKQNLNLKSVMFGLWIDGEPVLLKGLGISMTDVKATKDMHFRVGGVTETFETTLLLELVDQGKVSLDDPLSNWFPNLPASHLVTLRMIANSTSGYFDYVLSPAFLSAINTNPFREWLPNELIAISVAHPMLFTPGTNWSYSHTNFVILGEVIKKITGTSLAKAMNKYIIHSLN